MNVAFRLVFVMSLLGTGFEFVVEFRMYSFAFWEGAEI